MVSCLLELIVVNTAVEVLIPVALKGCDLVEEAEMLDDAIDEILDLVLVLLAEEELDTDAPVLLPLPLVRPVTVELVGLVPMLGVSGDDNDEPGEFVVLAKIRDDIVQLVLVEGVEPVVDAEVLLLLELEVDTEDDVVVEVVLVVVDVGFLLIVVLLVVLVLPVDVVAALLEALVVLLVVEVVVSGLLIRILGNPLVFAVAVAGLQLAFAISKFVVSHVVGTGWSHCEFTLHVGGLSYPKEPLVPRLRSR